MSRVTHPHRQHWIVRALLLALVVRALIPAGFMPAANFSFQICPDDFPAHMLRVAAASPAQSAAAGQPSGHSGHPHSPPGASEPGQALPTHAAPPGDDAQLGHDALAGRDAQLGHDAQLRHDAQLGHDALPGHHAQLGLDALPGHHALPGHDAQLGHHALLGDEALASHHAQLAADHAPTSSPDHGTPHRHAAAGMEHCTFAAAAGPALLAWTPSFSSPAIASQAPDFVYVAPSAQPLRFRVQQPRGPPALS